MTMHFYRSIMISIMFLIHSRIHLRLVAIGTTSIFIWYVSSEHDSCTFTLMCISIVYFFVNQIDENNCLHINYERIMHRQISSSSKFSVTILDISTRKKKQLMMFLGRTKIWSRISKNRPCSHMQIWLLHCRWQNQSRLDTHPEKAKLTKTCQNGKMRENCNNLIDDSKMWPKS